MRVQPDACRTAQPIREIDFVLNEQRQIGDVRRRTEEVGGHIGARGLSSRCERVPPAGKERQLQIGAVARGTVEVLVVVEVVPVADVLHLGSQLQLERRGHDRSGGHPEDEIGIALPVAQVRGIHFETALGRKPGEELLQVLALPAGEHLQGLRRLGPEDGLGPPLPSLLASVLAKTVGSLASREHRDGRAADLPRMLDLEASHAQALVGEVQVARRVEHAVVAAHGGARGPQGRARDHIDHAGHGVRAPQGRVGALDDLDAIHVEQRQDAEVDPRFHARKRPVAVQQHQDPAADPAGDTAGAADVHMARVEGHALGERERLLEVGYVAALELVRAQDRDAHRCVAGTHCGSARGDGHARDVEELRFERNAERLGCGAGGVGRNLQAAVAVGDDKERVRAAVRHGNHEAAIVAR